MFDLYWYEWHFIKLLEDTFFYQSQFLTWYFYFYSSMTLGHEMEIITCKYLSIFTKVQHLNSALLGHLAPNMYKNRCIKLQKNEKNQVQVL